MDSDWQEVSHPRSNMSKFKNTEGSSISIIWMNEGSVLTNGDWRPSITRSDRSSSLRQISTNMGTVSLLLHSTPTKNCYGSEMTMWAFLRIKSWPNDFWCRRWSTVGTGQFLLCLAAGEVHFAASSSSGRRSRRAISVQWERGHFSGFAKCTSHESTVSDPMAYRVCPS